MSEIIPSEVITVPLLIIMLAFFVPVLCLKLTFYILNKILKLNLEVSKSNKFTCISAWLFPLLFILQSNFAEHTITYIFYCFISCLVVAVITFFSKSKAH